MKRDITPIQKPAPEHGINLCLEMHNQPLYAVERADGSRATVIWNAQELNDFQPNRSITEMIKGWTTDTSGELQFVEYVYNPKLKLDIKRGKLTPVVAKQDILSWCKKGDEVSIQAILLTRDKVLVNELWYWIDDHNNFQGIGGRPHGLGDVPVDYIHTYDNGKRIVKCFEATVAKAGSLSHLVVITEKGEFPASNLIHPLSHYFDKL